MRKVLLLAVFALWAMPAQARDPSFEVLCRTLPDYQPESGAAGADYVPGVNVHGTPVAPADLGPSLNAGMDVINIPVSIDLIERFGLSVPIGSELKPDVASIAVHRDGRVSYNDQDLTRRAYSICAKNGRVPLEGTRPVMPVEKTSSPPPASAAPTKIYDLPTEPKLAVPKDTDKNE